MDEDRRRWDERYAAMGDQPQPRPPRHFPMLGAHLPPNGTALELACGRGEASVWFAQQGLTVTGYDVSPVAVSAAQRLAADNGVADRCQFDVTDLDDLPVVSHPADVVLCHLFLPIFSDLELESLITKAGIIAIATLSEVGHGTGRFRTPPGYFLDRYNNLAVIEQTEADGIARLIARHK